MGLIQQWATFGQLLREAKAALPPDMNSTQRKVALCMLVHGVEQTGADVQAYRDAIHVLNGGRGRVVRIPGKRAPKQYPCGRMWLRGKPTTTWLPAQAP